MSLAPSWVESANRADTDFPLNNLPHGVFSLGGGARHCGLAIGDDVLDVTALAGDGHVSSVDAAVFAAPSWNAFMALGHRAWRAFREEMTELLRAGSAHKDTLGEYLFPRREVALHMPFELAEFTDFYASKHHATNVGTMFRGAEHALPLNWLTMPIGYNGRASSVVLSGTDVRRPWGQLRGEDGPRLAPSERFDFELELGAVVGAASSRPLTVAEADAAIFGYVLLNDWSARDIQAWEYQPLGPFQGKATATTISPWIVPAEALAPFRCAVPEREVPVLRHLEELAPSLFDIALEADLLRDGGRTALTRTNYAEMYWSSAQQLAHHASSGCPMRIGDLLGSGTVSGPERENRGSMLELSWNGELPLETHAGPRHFLEDGDEIVLRGAAQGDGYRVGFGEARGKLLPALDDPWDRST
ncbi:MAG: fumarylacetoacetase [Pseudomonadota bacterium]